MLFYILKNMDKNNKFSEQKSLNAAVIGLGVGEQHIYGYQKHKKCIVKKICDFDNKKLIEVHSRNPHCLATKNPDDILEDPEIDVVSIASFDNFHHDQVIKALDNNKHVFVEKPLCLNRKEYESIAFKLSEKRHLRLSSNLILRKTERFIKLRNKIKSGELGKPYLFESNYNYGRIHKIYKGWRGEIPFYSVMHGGGIHLIDLLLWLSNKKIHSVKAIGTNIATKHSNFKFHDCIAAQLEFDGGAIGQVVSNYPSVVPHGHKLAIYCDNGTFYHGPLGSSYFYSRDPKQTPEMNNENYPGVRKGDMIFSFVECIINNTKPEVSENDVFNAMNVSLAIEESLHKKETVKISYLNFER